MPIGPNIPTPEEVIDVLRVEGFTIHADAMPKGKRGSACDCPLAKLLRLEVRANPEYHFSYRAWDPVERDSTNLPYIAERFVALFDQGYYPELIEGEDGYND